MLNVFDPQAAFVAVRTVKASFTLTLILLGLADRRIRGMRWLALGAAINIAAAEIHGSSPVLTGLSVDLLPGIVNELSCLAIMLGLHGLSLRVPHIRRGVPVAVLVLTLASALAGLVLPRATLFLVHVLTVSLLIAAVWLAWGPRFSALRPVLRAIAVVLCAIAALRLVAFRMLGMSPFGEDAHSASVRLANTVLLAVLYFLFIAAYVAESSRRMHAETRVDPLTGLGNRRAIEEIAEREMERATATQRPLALLMLDLDHFKRLNDTLGHALGDRALQQFGSALQWGVQPGACVARLGGEEFAVLLPGCAKAEAAEIAERLRSAVQNLWVSQDDITLFLSVSIGVCEAHPGETDWSKLLHRADMALYRAKREGRNRVLVCEEEPVPAPTTTACVEGERSWRRFFSGRPPLL